jgi:hypothetical protein
LSLSGLLRWQWDGYSRYHCSRFNLLLHIVVVPLFLLGNVVLVVALVQRSWLAALGGTAAMLISVALQGRGHRTEVVPPEPFTGSLNAVSRISLEQWVTFPRFVLSGNWVKALRQLGQLAKNGDSIEGTFSRRASRRLVRRSYQTFDGIGRRETDDNPADNCRDRGNQPTSVLP